MLKVKRTKIVLTVLAIICGISLIIFIGLLNHKKLIHTTANVALDNAPVERQLAGEGTEKSPYIIDSLDALCLFRDNVNSGHRYYKQYVLQTADIDMSSIDNWTPIGVYGKGNHFYGYYNGDGHTLSNLNIYDPNGFVGLFGELGGTVVNLGIESGSIHGVCVGAIASHSVGGEALIANCYNKASVSGFRVGGMADNFTSGTIINCLNLGDISEDGGGIVGYNGRVIDCFSSTANIISSDFVGNATDSLGTFWRYDETEPKDVETATKVLNKNLTEISTNMLNRIDCNDWEMNGDNVSFGSSVNSYIIKFIIVSLFGTLLLLLINVLYMSSSKNNQIEETGTSFGATVARRINRFKQNVYSFGRLRFGFVLLAQIAVLLSAIAILCGHTDSVYVFTYERGIGTLGDFFTPLSTMATTGIPPSQYYNETHDVYPPVPNIIFWLISLFLPQRSRLYDYSFTASFNLLVYMTLIMLWAVAMYNLLKKKLKLEKYSMLVCILLVFCAPICYLIERGNILILCLLLLTVFAFYYDSESRVLRELALIALAFSAAIKIYPAIFGLILVREKRYKETIRCLIYGILVFMLPFIFYGGLDAFRLYFEDLFGHAETASNITVDFLVNYTNIIKNAVQLLGASPAVVDFVSLTVHTPLMLLLLVYSLLVKKKWKAMMAVSLFVVLFPWTSVYYTMFIYVIPLVFLLIDKDHDITDVFYLVFLSFCVLPMQFFAGILRVDENSIWQMYALAQIVILLAIVVECVIGLVAFISKSIKKGKNKKIAW